MGSFFAALCGIDEQLCYVKDDEPDAESITLHVSP